jgi:hypothetical protein
MPRRLGLLVAIVAFAMSASSANAIVVPINPPPGFSPFGALHDLAARIIEDTEHIVASIERAAGNLIPGPSPSYTAAAAAPVSEPAVAPAPPANNPPLTQSTTTVTAAEQPIVAAAIIPSTQSGGDALSARLASLTSIVGNVLALLPSLENQEPQSDDVSVQSQIDALSREIAQTNQIGALSNVTIENPTVQGGISGLTAADIPTLDYLPLAGGSLAGNLSISGNATTSGAAYVAGNLGIGTSTSQDALALNGSAYLASITAPLNATNRLYANAGNLYWSGSLLGGASTGNWTSDGTNVWRSGGAVGIGTSSPFATLSVVGSGYFTGGLTAANASTTNLSVSGNSILGNATSTSLFSPVADFTNGIISTLNASVANLVGLTATNATSTNLGVSGTGYFAGPVGIGTTSPSRLLTLDSSSATGTILRMSNTSAGGHVYDFLETGSANTGGAGRLDFFDSTENAARLSIAANGNVGIGTTSPLQALSVNGNEALDGGLAIQSNGISTLTDLQGTSQYMFNSWAPRLWQLADGTSLNPVTTSGATFKISRTEAVASSTCNYNNVDNECNAALLVESNSAATAASSSMQTAAVVGLATGQPIGTDVVGITGEGDLIGAGTGIGTGAYFEGRRDTSTGSALGAEVRVENNTNTPGSYNPNGFSNTQGLWITTSSSPSPEPSSGGIDFGGIGGSQFITGIGFTAGSVATTTIRDDTSSVTSLEVNGTHTYGLLIGPTAGTVGIGTTNPSYELDVATSSYIQARFEGANGNGGGINIDNSSGGQQSLIQLLDGGHLEFQIGKQTNNSFFLYDASNTRNFFTYAPTTGNLVLNPTIGNVGVGTTTPGSPLSLAGIANFTTATSTFYSTGGISLTTGCYALNGTCLTLGSFSGTLAVNQGGTGSTTLSGILKGTGTGSILSAVAGVDYQAPITAGTGLSFSGNTLNDYWTLNGSNNLYNNNSGTEIGINNSSPSYSLDVGGFINTGASYGFKQAGNTVLAASSTIFSTFGGIGAGAGVIANATSSSVTSGVDSTAFGYQALNSATTSSDNTALGYQALKGSGSGTFSAVAGENTAVGSLALRQLTAGNVDTALGYQALSQDTTGSNSVAMGVFALGNDTTGGGNVAVGRNALLQNQTGSNNTAVGLDAGQGVSSNSFSNNVLFGYQSGGGLSTGSNNIFIGTNTASTTSTGSNNTAIGYDIALPSINGSNQLDIANLIFGTGVTGQGTTVSTGQIGIGTTTPYSTLEVWGPDTASSTPAFNVVNNASTSEFTVFDGGNAELAGNLSQNSDQRLKTNVQSLDASSSLSLIDQLNPVTFNWIDPNRGTTLQLGFIAQQVEQVFPNLVSTTSPTALTPDGTLSLNYIDLISPIVSAIQALSNEIASIENTLTGFAQSFTTHQLCVDKSDGSPVCVNGDQLAALLASENQSSAGGTSSVSVSNSTSATDTPPVIQINGDNPAIVQVGASYADLGATITGPQADLNLGIQTFFNGVPVSNIVIDTSAVATDTIDYVATDQNGLTTTSTRTVIVEPAATPLPPTASASSTAATSTVSD